MPRGLHGLHPMPWKPLQNPVSSSVAYYQGFTSLLRWHSFTPGCPLENFLSLFPLKHSHHSPCKASSSHCPLNGPGWAPPLLGVAWQHKFLLVHESSIPTLFTWLAPHRTSDPQFLWVFISLCETINLSDSDDYPCMVSLLIMLISKISREFASLV